MSGCCADLTAAGGSVGDGRGGSNDRTHCHVLQLCQARVNNHGGWPVLCVRVLPGSWLPGQHKVIGCLDSQGSVWPVHLCQGSHLDQSHSRQPNVAGPRASHLVGWQREGCWEGC